MNFLSLSLICHSCNLIKGQSVLIFKRECKGALAMLLTNRSGQQNVHKLILWRYTDVYSLEYNKLDSTKSVTEN